MSSLTISTTVWVDCQPCCSSFGIVDPQLGLARLALLAEAQLRQRGAVEVERITLGQILRRHVAEVGPHEPLRQLGLVAPEAVGELHGQRVDDLGLDAVSHSPPFRPPCFS